MTDTVRTLTDEQVWGTNTALTWRNVIVRENPDWTRGGYIYDGLAHFLMVGTRSDGKVFLKPFTTSRDFVNRVALDRFIANVRSDLDRYLVP